MLLENLKNKVPGFYTSFNLMIFKKIDLIVAQSMVNWMETTPDCEYGKTQDFAGNTQASTGFIMLKSGALKPNKNTKANTLVK